VKTFGIAMIGALAAASLWIGLVYRRDIGHARARVTTGSQVVTTPCGEVEYAETGDGPAILMIHGAGGGFDQGIALADSFAPRGRRVIAMSRFGYLRTPVPEHASVALQADAHACLLDALGVRSAAVIGVSAGAPSALEFALRHAERCTAVVLVVPGWFASPDGAPHRLGAAGQAIFEWGLGSDVAFWIFAKFFPRAATRGVLGTPPGVVAAADDAEQARVASILSDILPVSQRAAGLSLEAKLTTEHLSKPLDSIKAPTLVISAKDDLYGTWRNAEYIARGVPHARFIGYPVGGHMLVGHAEEVRAAVARFLDEISTAADLESTR
jgi:2-hydroxy-6-oxonona-2,4-dienedioate hydrolase